MIASTAVWPLGARAEQPAMPVIAFSPPSRRPTEAGYVEGRNLAIEYRFTKFRPGLMP